MQARYLSIALFTASIIGVSSAFAIPASKNAQTNPTVQTAQPANPSNALTNPSDQNTQPVDMNKVSFSIGYTMGSNLIEQFKQLNQSELLKGFQQGLSGAQPTISKEDMQRQLINFQRQAMQQRFEDLKKLADINKQEGDKFLAENKSKPGVTATKSGLQYKVLTKGNGPTPNDTDRVFVNYSGRLINGEVFSTSQELGDKPAAFTLNGVIPAWKEALKLMPKGSKWEIYVPSDLAYGARGTHGKIGPNATLIFTIELVDVQKANAQSSANTSKS